MKFKDDEHHNYFYSFYKKANVQNYDTERLSLFYILALFSETRKNIDSLYDFERNLIIPEGLNAGWQTGGTTKATKLAFNLYNNYLGQLNDEGGDYSPLELFSVSAENREFLIEGLKLRFS